MFIVVIVCLVAAKVLWNRLTAPGLELKGKHVIVTGGSTGLGLATAIKVNFFCVFAFGCF